MTVFEIATQPLIAVDKGERETFGLFISSPILPNKGLSSDLQKNLTKCPIY
jgi:hypothetical protein